MDGSKRLVCVVGQHRVQNELLADLISTRTGIETSSVGTLPEVNALLSRAAPGSCVVLNETPTQDRDKLLELLPDQAGRCAAECTLALFNVAPGQAIEREAFALGIKGFFYKDDSPGTLVRGVQALFDGELWMTRRLMSDCLLCGDVQRRPPPASQSVLTPREVQILRMLATGVSNDGMADQLCISLNTVKTHVYRIFRKLEVDNSLQAALWAAENL